MNLQFSAKQQARYVRSVGCIPLSTEHSVSMLKTKLLGGGENKGFKMVKTLNIKKWYRKAAKEKENQTNGAPARLKVVWSFVPAEQTRLALEHWIGYLAGSGQILRFVLI